MALSTELGIFIAFCQLTREAVHTKNTESLFPIEKVAMATFVASEAINKFLIHLPQEQKKFFFQGERLTKHVLLTGLMISHNNDFPIPARLVAMAITAFLFNSNIWNVIGQIQNPGKKMELIGCLYGTVVIPIFCISYFALK